MKLMFRPQEAEVITNWPSQLSLFLRSGHLTKVIWQAQAMPKKKGPHIWSLRVLRQLEQAVDECRVISGPFAIGVQFFLVPLMQSRRAFGIGFCQFTTGSWSLVFSGVLVFECKKWNMWTLVVMQFWKILLEIYLLRPCGILSDSDKPVKSGEGGKDDC